MTVTNRERSIWFVNYLSRSQYHAARAANAPYSYDSEYAAREPLEFACLQTTNMRRVARGERTLTSGHHKYWDDTLRGYPEGLDPEKTWESEWRAMAAEMLTPEVGS